MFKSLSKYKVISLLSAIIVVNNIIYYSFNLGFAYYIVLGVLLLGLLMKGHISYVNKSILFLMIAIVLSIVLNDILPFFKPWERFFSFVIVAVMVSPFIGSPTLYRFRCETFILLQYLMVGLTILSFMTYLAGINNMGLEIRGHSGVTGHSMIMGPVAANALLFSFYRIYVEDIWHKAGKTRYIYLAIIAIAFILVLLSRSRSTLMALLIALMALILLKNRLRSGKALRTVLAIAIISTATYPLWKDYTKGIEDKNIRSEENGGILSSRESIWQYRLDEFKNSPVIGIGYASIHKGDFSRRTGIIESGTSWLAILSMTGILGFAAFLGVYFGAVRHIRYHIIQKFTPSYCLMGAIFVFYSIHMIAEGYIFAAGNFLFFTTWLTFGTIFAADKTGMTHIKL